MTTAETRPIRPKTLHAHPGYVERQGHHSDRSTLTAPIVRRRSAATNRTVLYLAVLAGLVTGSEACGGRETIWDRGRSEALVQQLNQAVALVDDPAHRVVLLQPGPEQALDTVSVPIGHHAISTGASPSGDKLFVLCTGDQPQTKPSDEPPSLTVIDPKAPTSPTRFVLPDALTSLAIDPTGKRLIVYAGDTNSGSFITNPNELIFIDLEKPPGPDNPVPRTLPSLLGGFPRRLTFAPGVNIDGGTRELLVIESERDVMLLDLDRPYAPEITLPISDRFTQANALVPRAVAIDTGAGPTRPPTIAVRSDSADVVLFSLMPSNAAPPASDFQATAATVDATKPPSDFAFVHTEQGVRLALLVPGAALLVDPSNGETVQTTLADSYQKLSVAALAGSSPPVDLALLYGAGESNAVALWNLGKAFDPSSPVLNPPQRVALGSTVSSVVDVPSTPRKILRTSGNVLYVFDLERQTASPLTTNRSDLDVRVARDGTQAWAFASGQPGLAQVELSGPHVETIVIDEAVADVFEVDRGLASKALIMLHGTVSARRATTTAPGIWRSEQWMSGQNITVLDASDPNPAKARHYTGTLLEGLLP